MEIETNRGILEPSKDDFEPSTGVFFARTCVVEKNFQPHMCGWKNRSDLAFVVKSATVGPWENKNELPTDNHLHTIIFHS